MAIATTFTQSMLTAMLTVLATHTFKVALIKPSPTGTYGKASTNYSELVANGDQITGTGYTVGGATVTGVAVGSGNINGTYVSWLTFDPVIWVGATFSARGFMLYDTTDGNRAIACVDFGETKSVVASSFTINLPTADVVNAALRLFV